MKRHCKHLEISNRNENFLNLLFFFIPFDCSLLYLFFLQETTLRNKTVWLGNNLFLLSLSLSLFLPALCLLSEDIYDYHFVSQGKIEIPNVDDGEEMRLTDVSIRTKTQFVIKKKKIRIRILNNCLFFHPTITSSCQLSLAILLLFRPFITSLLEYRLFS